MHILLRWIGARSGATTVEYGIIAALVALGLYTTANNLGGKIGEVLAAFSAPSGGPPPGHSNNGS